MNSNQRKDATLGMPHGTANNRLRKNILFYVLKKHNENVCFKCQQAIEKAEDLSVEHKKPWEGVSAELFWDLENIAFSHLRCNKADRPKGKQPISRPDGLNWCTAGKHFASIGEFSKDSSRWNGLQHNCKNHRPVA